ncbi:hypothetical protein QBC34DRAFT_481104 [Podospora aff. communis PSN243]|uniref:LYC1 C-terminal domain-containing protein n=1 Tax=Podospora aff. communis PSN243 TaxID=3040156 RepID=A0AAV9H5D1_9PEZI|nr:hypothetical protein QBC34DRAFT_481104 [Podospora aff. communis PSN243]
MQPPPSPPKNTTFTLATSRQRTLAWTLNATSWAGPLTLAQYLTRETTLSCTALSSCSGPSPYGTPYYVLHLASDPDEILSACEVTVKRALVLRTKVKSGGKRARGLAGYLLRCVQREVDGVLGCEFGVLYSDIGREYYTGLGWMDGRNAQVVFTLEQGLEAGEAEGVVMLGEGDVKEFCERDEARQRERLEKGGYRRGGDAGWHFARDRYVSGAMRDGREVVNRGTRTNNRGSWLYWDHDLREKKLKIYGSQIAESGTGRETQDWDLPSVTVWIPAVEVCVAAMELWQEIGEKLKVVFEERQHGSIPSLRWKDGKDSSRIIWEDNEYFAWC